MCAPQRHFPLDSSVWHAFLALFSVFDDLFSLEVHHWPCLQSFIRLLVRTKPLGVHQLLKGLWWVRPVVQTGARWRSKMCPFTAANAFPWTPKKHQCCFSKEIILPATRNTNTSPCKCQNTECAQNLLCSFSLFAVFYVKAGGMLKQSIKLLGTFFPDETIGSLYNLTHFLLMCWSFLPPLFILTAHFDLVLVTVTDWNII